MVKKKVTPFIVMPNLIFWRLYRKGSTSKINANQFCLFICYDAVLISTHKICKYQFDFNPTLETNKITYKNIFKCDFRRFL